MKKKGFTLIELMITLAIFSIFSVYLFKCFSGQIRENTSFNKLIDFKYNGDKAMNSIVQELRNNNQVAAKLSVGSAENIIQVTTDDNKVLIDLTGSAASADLKLVNKDGKYNLVDSSNIVICNGIDSITMKQGQAANNEQDLINITVTLFDGNNQYTVTSAVNINK